MKSSSKKAPSKKIMVLQRPEPIKKEVNEPKEIKTVAKKEKKPMVVSITGVVVKKPKKNAKN